VKTKVKEVRIKTEEVREVMRIMMTIKGPFLSIRIVSWIHPLKISRQLKPIPFYQSPSVQYFSKYPTDPFTTCSRMGNVPSRFSQMMLRRFHTYKPTHLILNYLHSRNWGQWRHEFHCS